jgi:hypothetical protein
LRPDLRRELLNSLPHLSGDPIISADTLASSSILRGQSSIVNSLEDLIGAVLLCMVAGQNALVNLTDEPPPPSSGLAPGGELVYAFLARVFGAEIEHGRYKGGFDVVQWMKTERESRQREESKRDWCKERVVRGGGEGGGGEGGGGGGGGGGGVLPTSHWAGGPYHPRKVKVLVFDGLELLPEIEQMRWEEEAFGGSSSGGGEEAAASMGGGASRRKSGAAGEESSAPTQQPLAIIVAVTRGGLGSVRQPLRDRFLLSVSMSYPKFAHCLFVTQIYPCPSYLQQQQQPHVIGGHIILDLIDRFHLVTLHLSISRYLRQLVATTRQADVLGLCLTHRGSQALEQAARALAVCACDQPGWSDGAEFNYCTPALLAGIVPALLAHRLDLWADEPLNHHWEGERYTNGWVRGPGTLGTVGHLCRVRALVFQIVASVEPPI